MTKIRAAGTITRGSAGRAITGAIAALSCVTALAIAAPAALAGTNGQQVEALVSSGITHAQVYGHNQNGNLAYSPVKATYNSGYGDPWARETLFTGYYYVGWVTVFGWTRSSPPYNLQNNAIAYQCWVPRNDPILYLPCYEQ